MNNKTVMEHYNKYIINIFERYTDLKKSKKDNFDNNDLWKIFEYYSCIKLSEEYNKQFYEYDDIDPTFKEINKMSRNDTGIDCSDLDNTIVQCKLRKNTLTWKECSTFFGSQVIFNSELKKPIVRWDNLIITRNNDCTLSENLLERKELFIDKPYNKNKLIDFCENLIINPPTYPVINNDFNLRDYQIEAIKLIKSNKKNVIINLPTGTGKNSVIIYSLKENKKYLILVPRIILMEQLKKEIIKHKSTWKSKIQLIGDSNNTFDENKLITLCVFNSVHLIENYCYTFKKIFIDEAHHINKPAIYYENEEYDNDLDKDGNDLDNNNLYEDKNNLYEDNNDLYEDDNELDEDSEEYIVIDDSEDELVNVKKYTEIIKSLVQYNNNVYLSATIDKTDNFEYYNKDIRDMITLGYLCDYQIHVPIFNDDPTNKNICEHLLKNYRNIIIYCNSQKEGKLINKLMNKLQLNSSEYIDCNTSNKSRNNIIEKYQKGDIPFLVNVRILVEGFDAPITKGVCFMHLPTNKTTLIQIIGRCLRLHPTKTIANIILPFSTREDEKNICNFLKVMAKNDSRIKQSFENKILGGYISIENTNDEDEDIEFKYNMIYDSFGILQNGEEIWMNRLEDVKKYIDENSKRPSSKDKNKIIKSLGCWIGNQVKNYKDIKQIMKTKDIYNKWTEFIKKYKIYFYSNEELWIYNLKQVEEYIIKNNKRPSTRNEDNNIKYLGLWCCHQQSIYEKNKYIMKNENIKKLWEEFIKKYKIYFQSNKKKWNYNLKQVEEYIIKNNKRPSTHDENNNIVKLGAFINTQQYNYNKNIWLMKETHIRKKWEDFIKKYKIYFQSNEELWIYNLKQVEEYIIKNNKRPSTRNEDNNIKYLGEWVSGQQKKYKNNNQIMKDNNINQLWKDFIEKYKIYFQSKEELWIYNLKQVEKYIIENNKKPSKSDKNENINKIGKWINHQQNNYKNKTDIMKNEEIYNTYKNFIEKYKIYFQLNEEKWLNNLEEVKKYIDKNGKRPSSHDKTDNIKFLGSWINTQKNNYRNNKQLMKEKNIRIIWDKFIEKYKIYFESNEEVWNDTLQKVINYINENNKRPSMVNKNIDIKNLGKWIGTQQTNYKNKINIMSNEEIYNKWNEFVNDPLYKKYF